MLSGLSTKYIDSYMTLCKDSNAKVAVHALTFLSKNIHLFRRMVCENAIFIVSVLEKQIGSVNQAVRSLAIGVMSEVLQFNEGSQIYNAFTNQILHGSPHTQELLLSMLLEKLPMIYDKRDSIVKKYFFKLSFRLLERRKKALLQKNRLLINKLYDYFGEEYL